MRLTSLSPVAAVLVCLGGAAAAQAGGSVWGYKGGEFRREASGKWVEYQNGKAAFSFVDTGIALDRDDAALRCARAGCEHCADVGPTFGAVAVVGGDALRRKTVVGGQSSAHA